MKNKLVILFLVLAFSASAQKERDTVLNRCPVYLTDTVSINNFFLEFQPSTIHVYRVKGKLTVAIQQKDQFFTLFFHDNKLKNTIYKIVPGSTSKKNVEAKYSFRSTGAASFVNVVNGQVEVVFDEEKDLWHLKVNGMLTNLVERSVTYYKVRADFYIE